MGIFSSTLQTSNRVVKWVMRLQPYKFKIEIVKGKDNVVADALSRIPWKILTRASEQAETPELNLMMLEVDDGENLNYDICALDFEPLQLNDIIKAQKEDVSLSKLRKWIEDKVFPTKDDLASEPPM